MFSKRDGTKRSREDLMGWVYKLGRQKVGLEEKNDGSRLPSSVPESQVGTGERNRHMEELYAASRVIYTASKQMNPVWGIQGVRRKQVENL